MIGGFLKRIAPTHAASWYEFQHDGLIHFLEGRRGRGKSYTMTEFTRRAAVQRRPVRTNTQSIDYYRLGLRLAADGDFPSLADALEWLYENVRFLRHWDDLLTVYDEYVLIDEVTRLFEARAGFSAQRTPPVVYEWFQQSRKAKATIILAGQSFEWLDKKIAQLVDLFWQTRREDDKRTGKPLHIWLYGLDPGGAGRAENVNRQYADFKQRLAFRLDTARLYNSWEMVPLMQGEPSFSSVAEIARYHEARGVMYIPEQRELLAGHLERLGRGGVSAVALAPPLALADRG